MATRDLFCWLVDFEKEKDFSQHMNMSQQANHRHTQRNVTRLELQGQRQANKLD